MRIWETVHARQTALRPPDPGPPAVTTWRFLRLAMVGVVVGLAVSVLYERAHAPGCWQESISAYFYTPVRGFLVGTLVAIGVALVAVKGNTDWEDLLLNLAGSCAPVVAFVPIPDQGTCRSVPLGTADLGPGIANNVTALLVLGGIGLVVVAVVGRARRTATAVVGFAAIAALYAGTVLTFAFARGWFVQWGHPVAAVAMFAFILVNVWLNAVNLYFTRRGTPHPVPVVNRYAVIGALMTLAVVVPGVLALTAHWRHWQLATETGLITGFAVFWVLQTAELWNDGLRTSGVPAGTSSSAQP